MRVPNLQTIAICFCCGPQFLPPFCGKAGVCAVDYLGPNLQISVEFFDDKPVGVELPQTVDLLIVQTEPGLKSATASSVTKPAKTETGLVVQVPPFINEGEKIRVDTSEGAYLSRA